MCKCKELIWRKCYKPTKTNQADLGSFAEGPVSGNKVLYFWKNKSAVLVIRATVDAVTGASLFASASTACLKEPFICLICYLFVAIKRTCLLGSSLVEEIVLPCLEIG